MRDKISLCLIVGNEPIHLARCLSQFAPAVGEIIVVHATGSVPRDVRIADICQRHGAVYDIYTNATGNDWPHVDNFAAARQKSFDLASKPWALWVDADDTPGPNFAEGLHELLTKYEAENFDAFCLFHDVAGRGIAHNLRERLVRRDAGKWVNRIHENFQLKEGAKIARCDAPVVVHLPHGDEPKQGSNRNLTILESFPDAERDVSALYHLHGELMGQPDRKMEALQLATTIVKRPDCKPTERYELFLNIAEIARPPILDTSMPAYGAMMSALHAAYKCQPWRREALALLGAMHLDLGDLQNAEAYLRAMMALPRPAEMPWTHRDGLYGYAGESIWTQLLRMTGQIEKADAIEKARIAQHPVSISIVHPTRGRPEQAARVRKQWLDAAQNPERIEYIFAFSEDDEDTRGILYRFRHALSPAGHLEQVGGTLVENYNAGVRASTGKIILTVQDDLHCPLHWDAQIEAALAGKLDKPAALQIRDGYRTDDLLITFCVTRPTLDLFGFDGGIACPEYHGVFVDNDYTRLVQKHGIVVPSDITLRHEHPAWNPAVPMDPTYAIENSDAGYRYGNEVYTRRWPADTTHTA